jgi:hypothetical protein
MSEPSWIIIFFISVLISAVVSTSQVALLFRDNSYLKYFVLGLIVSFVEFVVFYHLVTDGSGGSAGVGEVALNVFVLNPIIVFFVNYIY